jgi:hypothetical protein
MVVDGAAIPIALDTFAASDTVNFEFEYPVQGWSSNMVLSSSTSNRETYLKVSRETTSQQTTNGNESKIMFNGTPTTTGAISWDSVNSRATVNEDGLYSIIPKFTLVPASGISSGSIRLTTVGVSNFYSSFTIANGGTLIFPQEIYLKKGNSIEVFVTVNGANADIAGGGSAPDFTTLTITKLNTGSQTIGLQQKVVEKWRATSGTFPTTEGSLTTFTTKVVSTHGAYNTATNTFKADRDGLLTVSLEGLVSYTTTNTSDRADLLLYDLTNATYFPSAYYYFFPKVASAITFTNTSDFTTAFTKYPVVKGQEVRLLFRTFAGFNSDPTITDAILTFELE